MRRRFKSVEELTFADDGMFQAVLREPDICAELVERLLGVRVGRVEYPQLEKAIAPFYTTKGVRLDVYLKDEDKVIDVEMQSYPQEALGKRARYYQSMLDMDALMKGQSYKSLKESYVLFICDFDPFKNKNGAAIGLPRYTFKSLCLESKAANLDDKSMKVLYNASAYKSEGDEKIRALLRFIHTNEPGDGFSRRLKEIVERIKDSERFKGDYAAMNLHDQDIMDEARLEGVAIGARQKAEENAENLLKMNVLTLEQIAQATSLPLERVLELQKNLAAGVKA